MKNLFLSIFILISIAELCIIMRPATVSASDNFYCELQIEEPVKTGDTLQVLDITHGKQDTIWIGYSN